jgi:hypothetical protein
MQVETRVGIVCRSCGVLVDLWVAAFAPVSVDCPNGCGVLQVDDTPTRITSAKARAKTLAKGRPARTIHATPRRIQ